MELQPSTLTSMSSREANINFRCDLGEVAAKVNKVFLVEDHYRDLSHDIEGTTDHRLTDF